MTDMPTMGSRGRPAVQGLIDRHDLVATLEARPGPPDRLMAVRPGQRNAPLFWLALPGAVRGRDRRHHIPCPRRTSARIA
jgi:hypothetical protein